MQRKSGFPVSNCSIKMPDCSSLPEPAHIDEDHEQLQRRQQLINFGHSQWGFNNWSWTVTKQDLDFVDFSNGKYFVGVVAFVSITVKSLEIHRENIGYSTSMATSKGLAIHKSRKCAVTNALRETLLSFGGSVAVELMEALQVHREHTTLPQLDSLTENNQNTANTLNKLETKTSLGLRKEVEGLRAPGPIARATPGPTLSLAGVPAPVAAPAPAGVPAPVGAPAPVGVPAPVGTGAPRPQPPRPGSNVSVMLQSMMPPMYAPPRLPPPAQVFPNYYEYSGPWHFTYEPYERPHGNVNLNFNMPPHSLVVNGRAGSVDCNRGAEGEPLNYGPQPPSQTCWIKPTIFYDGFWTEKKVKKWVAQQVEKRFTSKSVHKPLCD